MDSTFAHRLDFLMRLTNTQNSTLARELNFDASYISRIRSGRRGMPRHQQFVESAANYFAENLREPYQRKAAADAIRPGHEWPKSRRVAASLIMAWLRGDSPSDSPLDRFLGNLASLPHETHVHAPENRDAQQTTAHAAPGGATSLYYGNEGKREAVETFLSELADLETPVELLLLSDEHMGWLYDDASFEQRWAALLTRIISQGGYARIVHTTNRDLGQMLEGVDSWLPLYMAGSIEPWWCPHVRDNIYRRTLFIARGYGAIISSSIHDDTEGMLNLLIRDPKAAQALEREYANFLALCKPLMRFEQLRDRRAAHDWIAHAADDVRDKGPHVMLHNAPLNEFALLVREGEDATLFRKVPPSTAVTVDEWSMASSFWEYLSRSEHVCRGGDEVAARLEEMAAQLA